MQNASDSSLRVIGWAIWYEDAFFSSKTTKWEDLPDDGVQVLYLYKSDGRSIGCCGDSSYFHVPPNIWGSNMDEPKETQQRYPGAIIKRGKWTSLAKLAELQQKAANYKWTD